MHVTPPPGVRVRQGAHATRITLPRRLRANLTVGLSTALFSVLVLAFAWHFSGGAIPFTNLSGSAGQIAIGVLFGLLHLLPYLLGLAMLLAGIAVLAGFGEITIARRTIRQTFRLAPFLGLGATIPLDSVAKIDLCRSTAIKDDKDSPMPTPSGMVGKYRLRLTTTDKKHLSLAGADERDWVARVADLVAEAIRDRSPEHDLPKIVDRTGEGQVDHEAMPAVDYALIPNPPERVRIEFVRNPDGIGIHVPPTGFVDSKIAPTMLGVGVAWIVGVALAMGIFFRASVPGLAGAVGFLALFAIPGLVLIAASIHIARRRLHLDVVGDALLVTQSSPFRRAIRELRRGEIHAVRVANSDASIDNKPLKQLRVVVRGSKDATALTGFDEDALRWTADALATALAVPAK